MNKAYLLRFMQSDEGTQGVFISKDFFCFTLELPNRNNQKNISCIPKGIYKVKYKYSPKFGNVYHLQNVKNRTYIYFHKGNTIDDTQGCILVGREFGKLYKKLAVLNSKITMNRLLENFGTKEFELMIEEKFI